jgi:hypothetical protein
MPGGYCKYEKNGDKHIHIVDVGIHGARIAAQAYGQLNYGTLDMPKVVEQGGKWYWVANIFCEDLIRNLRVEHWQFQDMMVRSRGAMVEIEHGGGIVQSKGERNVILAVIPPQLRRLWIKDYLSGAEEFDPQKVLTIPGGRHGILGQNGRKNTALPEPDKKDNKSKGKGKDKKDEKPKGNGEPSPPAVAGSGGADLQSQIRIAAPKLEASIEELTDYCSTFPTIGKAMLALTRAIAPDGKQELAELKKNFAEWKKQQKADESE